MTLQALLTEADMRRLSGVPLAVVHIDSLPYPPSDDFEATPGELRANIAALRRILKARMKEDASLKPLKEFGTDDLRTALENSVPNCMRTTNYTPGNDAADETAPTSSLHGPWRMDGLMRTQAAYMLVRDYESPLDFMQPQLYMPAALIENAWPEQQLDLQNLVQLHELTHVVQGVMHPLLRAFYYENETEHAFWHELDADLGALKWGKQLGISQQACTLMRDMRVLQAFNSATKHYWFTPQLCGIDASYRDSIAAMREVHAMSLIAMGDRKAPDAELMTLWSRASDGEQCLSTAREVKNLQRSFNRLADKLIDNGYDTKEKLQALAQLNRGHTFAQPLAQDIARLTVQAARQFCPSLVA